MVTASQVMLTATERVTLGVPAAEAVAQEAAARGASRVFILASSFLNRQTAEIRRIEAALGARHAATHDGIQPHAPRSDVLAAANAARAAGAAADRPEGADLLLRHRHPQGVRDDARRGMRDLVDRPDRDAAGRSRGQGAAGHDQLQLRRLVRGGTVGAADRGLHHRH